MSEDSKPAVSGQTIIAGALAAILSGSGGFLASHQEAVGDAKLAAAETARLELRVAIAESNIKGLANWINKKNSVELIDAPNPFE